MLRLFFWENANVCRHPYDFKARQVSRADQADESAEIARGGGQGLLHSTRGLRDMLADIRLRLDEIERAIEPPKGG